MKFKAVTLVCFFVLLVSACVPTANTPDPNSVVIWCPDCVETGEKLYLALLPDRWYPDTTMQVYHGDRCTVIEERIVKDMYWYDIDINADPGRISIDEGGRPYQFYGDVNIPVTLLNCDRVDVSGWMFTEFLKRESEIEK